MANLAWSCHCQTWSSMTLARFGKNLQGLSKMDMTCHDIVKYYHVMSWHCEWHVTEMSWPKILSWCLSWWQNALSRFVTYCHRDKKKCVTRSKNPVSTLTGKSKKRARFILNSQTFLSWSKRPFFCHGLSRWQTMTTLWQTVTNRDKPWQTMTNSWQNYDKPWQTLTILWQTLTILDNTMTNLGNRHEKP